MTGHIIEARGSLDDDGETVLVPLSIVRLTRAPPVLGGGPTTGPGHAPGPVVDSASGPEVGLALPHQETGELPLLVRAVQGDGRHPVSPAVSVSFAGREGGAAQPPGDQELLSTEGVVTSLLRHDPPPPLTACWAGRRDPPRLPPPMPRIKLARPPKNP